MPSIQLDNEFKPIDTVDQREEFEASLGTTGFVDELVSFQSLIATF